MLWKPLLVVREYWQVLLSVDGFLTYKNESKPEKKREIPMRHQSQRIISRATARDPVQGVDPEVDDCTSPENKNKTKPKPGSAVVVGVCPSRLPSHCQFTLAMEHLDTNSASQCGRVPWWPKRPKEVEGCRWPISLQPMARTNSTEQGLDLGRHILMEPRRTNQSEEVANSHRSREAGAEHHGWGMFHWKKTKAYFATKSFKAGLTSQPVK